MVVGIATNWMMHKKYNPNESNLNTPSGIPHILCVTIDEFENTRVGSVDVNPKTKPARRNRCAAADAFRLSRINARRTVGIICIKNA